MSLTSVASQHAQNVNFLVQRFVEDTPGVEQAIGVSADGLLMTMHATLCRDDADKLAAAVSGLTQLARGASQQLTKGSPSQVITEFTDGYLIVSAIGDRACLGVVASADCDLGLVGYESTMLVEQVGRLLTPELISELKMSLQ